MDEDLAKWLYDAHMAARQIRSFVVDATFGQYQDDIMLRSAVERQFEITGEALKRIRDYDLDTFESIRGARGAVSFRNILAHGYDSIDEEIVWGIIQDDLPVLIEDLAKLSSEI